MQPKHDRPTMHLGLRVSDLSLSRACYEDLLGVPPAKQKADYVKFELAEPPLALALVPGRTQAGELPMHLGLRVTRPEAVEAEAERLRGLGHELVDEGVTVCCYARQRKFWVHDPDGNAWEIYHRIEDTEVGYDESSACCSALDSTDDEAATGQSAACCGKP